ncbi:MAG: agmatinase family protein [Gemmatimonadetes bacterium]|nr:agmatinase family protein [Gemmatimonadota bacterium]
MPDGAPVLVGAPPARGGGSPGCERGPAALREALKGFSTYGGEPEGDLRLLGSVLDWGDLELPSGAAPQSLMAIRDAAAKLFSQGARPICLGGAHTVTQGVLAGLAASKPMQQVALLILDAHLDEREEEDSSTITRGAPFSSTLRSGFARGSQTAVVGLRPFANSRMFTEWMRESGVHLIMVDDVARWGAEHAAQVVLERVAPDGRPLYLSIDLDVVDPAYAPGTGHACPGGLSSREIITFLSTLLRRAELAGADIVELAPPLDIGERTSKLAARLLLEILASFTRG